MTIVAVTKLNRIRTFSIQGTWQQGGERVTLFGVCGLASASFRLMISGVVWQLLRRLNSIADERDSVYAFLNNNTL